MEEVTWEKRFDDDYELGGGFRDLQIMLRDRKGIEKGFAAHIRLIKDFIRTEKEKSYQEGVAAERKRIQEAITDALWNKDGSLKSHDISDIVSTALHQTYAPTNTI